MAESHKSSFAEFVGSGDEYYSRIFEKIQKSSLEFAHINFAAATGGFAWAAFRANWLLAWFGFAIDLIALVNLAGAYKYSSASARALADGKDFLVDRYDAWAESNLIAAVVFFFGGRFVFGWLADRLYYRRYSAWRIDRRKSSGANASRLAILAAVVVLIAPLTLYRASQFPPEHRTCIKQDRAIQKGEEIPFKNRFDCFAIGEFPTLFWLDRRNEFSFPRNEDGSRRMEVKPPREGLPPISLNTWTAQATDDGIAYLTAFYGWIFDGITAFLRTMLGAVEAVFVGTPWMITAGVFLAIAYKAAGLRIAVFVGLSLVYLALFGFWQTAMDTLSLVVGASIICVVFGLPLGVWVGKSRAGQAIVTPILDIMQTIPSFVYLLPAVAFFSIGKPPGIFATVIFAMPPMVRLTALGIKQVPENTKEAALAFGANPKQLLFKVELPLALPSIMAGVNQVVMMSLSMVVVAALIGAGGMGFIVTEALANTQTGRGILAGIGIALLAMMIDRVVQKAKIAKN
ncbi:MAG: proline/glycine betaine ABC transporter permease [Albidovulum sp.]|nr:proline/glycine betaine ABC transporter permease [Albidovulum sp.]MDE0307771.1 proline/glycine betaine ABC transporter permease [Albidovulum sp.]MDE0532054.1 proline/glycine betaine ABC transporter permease [Albidovulum sp.]